MKEREITYELFQDFVITKALINVTVKQVETKIFFQFQSVLNEFKFLFQSQCTWTQEGSAYGIDNKITNKGPPLSDSFILSEHTRYAIISAKGV